MTVGSGRAGERERAAPIKGPGGGRVGGVRVGEGEGAEGVVGVEGDGDVAGGVDGREVGGGAGAVRDCAVEPLSGVGVVEGAGGGAGPGAVCRAGGRGCVERYGGGRHGDAKEGGSAGGFAGANAPRECVTDHGSGLRKMVDETCRPSESGFMRRLVRSNNMQIEDSCKIIFTLLHHELSFKQRLGYGKHLINEMYFHQLSWMRCSQMLVKDLFKPVMWVGWVFMW